MPTCTGGGGREATGVPAEAATSPGFFLDLENRGEPLAIFWPQGLKRPNPLTYAYGQREAIGVPAEAETGQENF